MNKKNNFTFEQEETAIETFYDLMEGDDETGIQFLKTENKSVPQRDEDFLRFMGICLSIEEKEERKEHAPPFSKERMLDTRELDDEWFGVVKCDMDEIEPDWLLWEEEQED